MSFDFYFQLTQKSQEDFSFLNKAETRTECPSTHTITRKDIERKQILAQTDTVIGVSFTEPKLTLLTFKAINLINQKKKATKIYCDTGHCPALSYL